MKRGFTFIILLLLFTAAGCATKASDTPIEDGTGLRADFIDAGQADATLFTYEEYHILYDTGDWKRTDVVDYLHQEDITELDLIIISHPHADHIGQLAQIIEEFSVKEVWMTGNEHASKTFEDALSAILEHDVTYVEPRSGESFTMGSLGIDILHPETISGNLNPESLSALFTYEDFSFLLTGDAYQADEQMMLDTYPDLEADILQLGHHGSNTSSHPDFLAAIQPEVAIYSAGVGNSYGHPHEEVLTRLKNSKIQTYGTDLNGTITVRTDGSTYTVTTEKEENVPNKKEEKENKPVETEAPKETETNEANCININEASNGDLQKIVHIGPARAEDIIEQRPYVSLNELTDIDGIGPGRLDDIRFEDLACIDPLEKLNKGDE